MVNWDKKQKQLNPADFKYYGYEWSKELTSTRLGSKWMNESWFSLRRTRFSITKEEANFYAALEVLIQAVIAHTDAMMIEIVFKRQASLMNSTMEYYLIL